MKPVRICFISDDNYILPTTVAITSLAVNSDKNINYEVYVLTSKLSDRNKNILNKLNKRNVNIYIVEAPPETMYENITSNNVHVSSAALYKFNLAEIFDKFDKILYLDGDVIINKDLSEFFNIDLKDNYVAAVKDYRAVVSKVNPLKYLSGLDGSYFNSGVMLLNLKQLRRDNVKEKLIDYRLNGYNHFMDQDTLNVVFAGKVLYLPIYYNAMYSTVNHFKEKDIYEYYDLKKVETREEICANSYIIHLCSPTKPWKYRDSWHSNEWYGYYKKSPFKNRLLFRKIFNQPKTTREKAIKLLYNGMARVHQEGVVSTCKFVIKKVLPFQ